MSDIAHTHTHTLSLSLSPASTIICMSSPNHPASTNNDSTRLLGNNSSANGSQSQASKPAITDRHEDSILATTLLASMIAVGGQQIESVDPTSLTDKRFECNVLDYGACAPIKIIDTSGPLEKALVGCVWKHLNTRLVVPVGNYLNKRRVLLDHANKWALQSDRLITARYPANLPLAHEFFTGDVRGVILD